VYAVILLVILFSLVFSYSLAENLSEEFLAVKNWVLPKDAVPMSDLKLENDLQMFKSKPFSGVAYEKYPKGQLLRVIHYLHGKQDGLMMLWYPDGTPQMSANYREGGLHGRFLGWYHNGGTIYDMVINHGTYAGDNLIDGDSSREAGSREDSEREGPDNDKSPE
jgi:antitoxin component YwqK of YwqJK toxin-antitoxin module